MVRWVIESQSLFTLISVIQTSCLESEDRDTFFPAEEFNIVMKAVMHFSRRHLTSLSSLSLSQTITKWRCLHTIEFAARWYCLDLEPVKIYRKTPWFVTSWVITSFHQSRFSGNSMPAKHSLLFPSSHCFYHFSMSLSLNNSFRALFGFCKFSLLDRKILNLASLSASSFPLIPWWDFTHSRLML